MIVYIQKNGKETEFANVRVGNEIVVDGERYTFEEPDDEKYALVDGQGNEVDTSYIEGSINGGDNYLSFKIPTN